MLGFLFLFWLTQQRLKISYLVPKLAAELKLQRFSIESDNMQVFNALLKEEVALHEFGAILSDVKRQSTLPLRFLSIFLLYHFWSSIDPNTRGKHSARNKLVFQIRSITSVTKAVLTIMTPTSALPTIYSGCTVFQFPMQHHGFNFTYQLECSTRSDQPSSGQRKDLKLVK